MTTQLEKALLRASISRTFVFAMLLLYQHHDLSAQQSTLTLDRIFKSDEFQVERFSRAQWLPDGSGYTILEQTDAGENIVLVNPQTGLSQILVAASRFIPAGATSPLRFSRYTFSSNMRKLMVVTNSFQLYDRGSHGDYWVLDLSKWELQKLGGAEQSTPLMLARFSPDSKQVAYICQGNIYVEDLASGERIQITDDGSATIINGGRVGTYYGLNTSGLRWSPDNKHITYLQFDTEGVRNFYLINSTDSVYSQIITRQHVKPGERLPASRAGIVKASGGKTRWIQLEGDPRSNYITQLDWFPDSRHVVLQQLNRNQNTMHVIASDLRAESLREILTEKEETWLEPRNLQWLDGGKAFTWVSERDGWRHVYYASTEDGALTLLTKGAFDILNVAGIDEPKGMLYFAASPENPTQRYLYSVPLDGTGEAERVTPDGADGTHRYRISADSKWAFHTYSNFDTPSVVDLVELPSHTTKRTLVDNASLRKKLDTISNQSTEFFRIEISKGVELDGWCMKPVDFDPDKKYPVLFYVYGMPAGQTVLDSWVRNRYLWHTMLNQQGYIVMSIDNRGTPSPRGRAFRKIIYKKHGVLPAADQAAAVQALMKQRPYMDPNRIGVYGWSGGGCVSMHLIFRYPELYNTAMPGAGLSHHKFYEASFTERFLGMPQDNPDVYEATAPINMAQDLKGNLLIVHGTGDDNVHYQSAAALIERLVSLSKHFTMMAYPNANHNLAWSGATQYHLHDLYTRYLNQNMPGGAR